MSFIKKVFLLLIVGLAAAVNAKAQLAFEYAQYDVGVATGVNTVYGDAQTLTKTSSVHFNLNYNVSPFINYVFEVQLGQLKGGDSLNTTSGRQFTNNFTSVMLRGQVQLGEVIDYSQSAVANAAKNLYLSTGIGIVVNNLVNVNRYSIQLPGYYTPGTNTSNEVLIPVRIGYEFKVFNNYSQPALKIDLGYQYNFILGDDLDGYQVGAKNDAYSQFTIGLKFAIGQVTSYRKQIYY
jgi:hypothetical protein